MTFEEFIQLARYKHISPLEFHLLDKPESVLVHESSRGSKDPGKTFWIVAMALSAPMGCNPFMFALAVPNNSRPRFTVLSQLMGSGDSWIEARKIRFKRWVTEWITNHPEEILQAGIRLGYKGNSDGNIRVHHTVLERIRFTTNLAQVRSPEDPDFDADEWIRRARNDFHQIGDIAGNVLEQAGYEVIW